jgi:hypothetical protein
MAWIRKVKCLLFACFVFLFFSSCDTSASTTLPEISRDEASVTLMSSDTLQSISPTPTLLTPPAPDDDFIQGLEEDGYLPIKDFQGSLIGPGNDVYSIYGYTDSSLDPNYEKELLTPEICRMVFYRFDGENNEWIDTIGAPSFPESSRYAGYPVWCRLVNWDTNSLKGLVVVSIELRKQLGMHQYTSDINQNGLPEFAVFANYCPNACDNTDSSVNFYEIQDNGEVLALTDDLPGVLLPYAIFHSGDPVTLQVYDVGLEYEPHWEIDSWWVYQWRDGEYVDVSADYSADYDALIQPLLATVEVHYGEPLFSEYNVRPLDILSPLFLYEKQGLREQAYTTFMEFSDPEHWPGSDPWNLCWLQYIRASVSEDYRSGRSFQLPVSSSYFDMILDHLLEQFDAAQYDLSACEIH